jgi:hypothetical protein
MRTTIAIARLAPAMLVACGGRTSSRVVAVPDAQSDAAIEASGPQSACAVAGGACVVEAAFCASIGSQDCGAPGEYCCLPTSGTCVAGVQCMSAGGSDGSSDEAGAVVFPGCRRAASLDDAGPGVIACTVGRALVACMLPDAGIPCECVSDDLTNCPDGTGPTGYTCGPTDGFSCQNLCGPDQYAVSCGGVPSPDVFQEPPPGCRHAGPLTEEFVYLCCPCE